MYTKTELHNIVKRQLAHEYNCSPDDFSGDTNVITQAINSDKRRVFRNNAFFFKMATFGENAVISADKSIHAWLRNYVGDKVGFTLFEHTYLTEIDNRLKQSGKHIWQTHHMFLPTSFEAEEVSCPYQLQWLDMKELSLFGETSKFPNAFNQPFSPLRPDVLAVAAIDKGSIIAMAGCSADTNMLWQIGIDVMPQYRGNGLGSCLVRLLKAEIIRRGKIPYYGTSLSNLHSWNIALKCGFTPAWIETATVED